MQPPPHLPWCVSATVLPRCADRCDLSSLLWPFWSFPVRFSVFCRLPFRALFAPWSSCLTVFCAQLLSLRLRFLRDRACFSAVACRPVPRRPFSLLSARFLSRRSAVGRRASLVCSPRPAPWRAPACRVLDSFSGRCLALLASFVGFVGFRFVGSGFAASPRLCFWRCRFVPA